MHILQYTNSVNKREGKYATQKTTNYQRPKIFNPIKVDKFLLKK